MTDRLPPHSSNCEMAIIGSCLTTPMISIPECQAVIEHPGWFYDLRCQLVWSHLCAMDLNGVDIITLSQSLKDSGIMEQIGGHPFLSACQDLCFSPAQVQAWIEVLQEKFILRKAIATCTEAVGRAYEARGDVNEFLDQLERDTLAIRPNQRIEGDIKSLMRQAITKIEERVASPNTLSGLETGLIDLDRLSDGIHKGEMVVVAGFPSTGKTALSVNIAVHNALKKVPAAIFSAEMRPVQLVVRSLCSEARVNFKRLLERDMPRMSTASVRIANAPLYIEQANGLSIGQVSAIARRLKQKHNIQMIVVDYIQLLSGTGDNREQAISSISKGIKAMAMELDLPVLALSQLTDDGKLRESRAIGQDADSIWKLENDGEWKPAIQPIKLKIEKCRDGETGEVKLTFQKECTRFENVSKVSDEDVPN